MGEAETFTVNRDLLLVIFKQVQIPCGWALFRVHRQPTAPCWTMDESLSSNPSKHMDQSKDNLPAPSSLGPFSTNETKIIPIKEITPYQLDFWKPQNILTIEDTPFSKRFMVTLLIIAYSVPGNLARLSLQKLTNYENSYINYSGGTVVWVNFSASFVMSWCNNSVGLWSEVLKHTEKTSMKELALHSAITTGFCGSFSTLSSALIEIFFKTTDIVAEPLPHIGYRVTEFFAVSLITFALPILGHILGKHFALLLDTFVVPRIARFLTYKLIRFIELVTCCIGLLALIADLVLTLTLSIDNWYKAEYSFSMLVGSVAALIRFELSYFNGRGCKSWFPLGTLAVNLAGCLIITITELLLHAYKDGTNLLITNQVHRIILNGFTVGFCGSLTTMSTFINELYNLNHPKYQHIYFWSTFIPILAFALIIDGSYEWTRGFEHV